MGSSGGASFERECDSLCAYVDRQLGPAEEIEILDRRTGTKLHTRTLSALDRCPITATAGDVDTAVKRPIEDVYRQTLFDGFRGQAPPAASSSSAASAASASASEPPSTKAKTKKKKK